METGYSRMMERQQLDSQFGDGTYLGATGDAALDAGIVLTTVVVGPELIVAKYGSQIVHIARSSKLGMQLLSRGAQFADEAKLISHFKKHGREFGAKNADEYLQMARTVMVEGSKFEYSYKGEIRTGFAQFMGNNKKGIAKFAFVGTNNKGFITTLHMKTGKDFWKTLNGNAKDKTIRAIE
ncbi:hypothetical protein [Gallaecimonas mangrovi]|uniref:hypothetical protein n=1 Tax=Gallaecimonas mangrovi TaxID=2291597 RepID=UPI000E204544|nr:hypothetical protein [Gallaecimonas mangrovi]